jgi:uncharacterized protein (DUF885 family)
METTPVTRAILPSLALLVLTSPARADDPAKKPDPSASMPVEVDVAAIGPPPGVMAGVIARYEADRGSVTRSAPPRGSAARDELHRRLGVSWLEVLGSLDFDPMDVEDRVDYVLLRTHLEHTLRQLDHDAKHRAEVEPFAPFAPIILDLDASRRRMERPDGEKVAGELIRLTKEIKAAQAELGKAKGDAKPSKAVANRAAQAVAGLRTTLREYTNRFNNYDPLFSWWVVQPSGEADKALGDYETFLREKVVGLAKDDKTTIIGNPIGPEALRADLDSALIPYTPDELIAIAEREFAWCDAEMLRASRDMGCGDDWKKALETVKTHHVAPGEQPGMIRDLAIESTKFVEDNNLVTIPPLAKSSWRMEMMSPERQLVNPFFTGGEVLSVSFPTSGMTHEQKLMSMRGNNRHFSRATVHHEVIPGHHLQSFMMDRYRPYRQVLSTPFWMEGWALYWEMVLWDKGFPKTPEDRIGFLFWRMHRCARIVFSLKFHLGKMTPEECIDYLVDRVGHERENAAAEVRRSFNGSYGPLYQCAYMLGAMQLRALRKELVDSGKMPERAFHDAILRENAIPIEALRAILLGEKLPRDFHTRWKFAGDVEAP